MVTSAGFTRWGWRSWRREQRPTGSAFANLRSVLSNKPFLILLLAYIIGGFGSQLPATLFLYYVQYVLRSDLGGIFLLLYFGVGFLFLPVWVVVARRWGKRQSWIAAMAVNAGSFIGVLCIGAGDVAWYTAIVVCSGVGYGGVLAIPSSMQADVIDYDELRCGVRREGQITGLWLVANKIAAALGAGVALPLLARAGYIPNAEQPESAITMLKLLYGGVPCLCYGVAIVVACFYPITAASYAQIRAELDRRVSQ
ncbi:MAG: MFS transporter [Proteobacteria bacterium]|nr:MFS transporter [Pseudomonadota bacterium]